MNKIFAVIFSMALALHSGFLYAAPLEKNSLEYLQLEAMGYEIQPAKPSDAMTIAKSMGSRLIVNKAENGISVGRYFTRERKNLNQGEQFQLLKLVNDINTEESLQFSVQDTFLTVAAYYNGPYNQKVFAGLVRQLEASSALFDKYPGILKLVNN